MIKFGCLFSDLCNSGDYNTSREKERRPHNVAKRRPEGTQTRIQDAPFRSIKPSSHADETRRPLKPNTEQRMKNEMVSVHKSEKPMIPRRKPLARPPQEVSVATNLLSFILDMYN